MTHYDIIIKMCFLLNGRKQTEECYKQYYTDYNPIRIYVRNGKGDEQKVEFSNLNIIYTHFHVKFNGYPLSLIMKMEGSEWGDEFEFATQEDEDYAKKIFGENATANGVIVYTEQALKQALREYKKQIEDALAGNYR